MNGQLILSKGLPVSRVDMAGVALGEHSWPLYASLFCLCLSPRRSWDLAMCPDYMELGASWRALPLRLRVFNAFTSIWQGRDWTKHL
jgi:hypothetical protein